MAVKKKVPAKKVAAKKVPEKKSAVKKVAAKKAPAKKTTAKKEVAKKAPAKKVVVKKAPAKKVVAKKAAAKKVVAKKAAAKKVVAKKAAAKKVVVKKAAVKKVVAKKTVKKSAEAKKVETNKKATTTSTNKASSAVKTPATAIVEMAKVEILEIVAGPKKILSKTIEESPKAKKKSSAAVPEKKEGQVTLDENEFLHLKMAKAKHENPRESHPEEGTGPEVEHPPLSPIVRETPKVGRNEPCPCGSGLKYKKCHGKI